MIHIVNYFPFLFSKQWSMPLCAFFTTFTVVMTILILSTDLKVGRHYIEFNASNIWDFEESPQDSVELIKLIKNEYIFPPIAYTLLQNYTGKPSVQILNIFQKKQFGVFMECGSDGSGDTEWLEKVQSWRGLLTQPHPDNFAHLLTAERSRAHLAQVCISPTVYPKHAFFRHVSQNESLSAIPCFPLYSLMRAYNTSHLDLLSLNEVTAPLQVLKSLPVGRVRIKVISIRNPEVNDSKDYEDMCCDPDLVNFLEKWGYKASSCVNNNPTCYYICSRTYCPSLIMYS
ncbi:uncharacterized protein [Halyomorpha halys]|uniref:uncharacterized protein isoform X2 n=1 Tax=Halyomorpha halys TaxID=286706 RepID=UPI0006D4D9B2|nr:uncharacterized protein LOC106685970 [Halyomorpha halys]